jgi:hypothetical protein
MLKYFVFNAVAITSLESTHNTPRKLARADLATADAAVAASPLSPSQLPQQAIRAGLVTVEVTPSTVKSVHKSP